MTSKDKKLHLGAFDQIIPGWINTDVTPHLYVARVPGLAGLMRRAGLMNAHRLQQHRAGIFRQLIYLNVGKRFPFANESMAAVYSSHMMEHLVPEVGRACLQECFRVLRPNGVVRIAVPDLDNLIAAYDRENPNPFLEIFFEIHSGSAKNRHWWHYNECSLTRLLHEIGFRQTQRCEYRQGRCPDVETVDVRPDSLFVEGVK